MTSTIRAYLETTLAAEGDKGWLRRDPKTTHPEILAAVRTLRYASPTRQVYNDDAEQYVERVAGDLPEHHYHAHPDRDPLTNQLGHEVYIAQCLLHDEDNLASAMRLREQGFVPIAEADPQPGKRYDVATGTLYSGYEHPTYGKPKERCRLYSREPNGQYVFLPYRSRVNGFYAPQHALIREVA